MQSVKFVDIYKYTVTVIVYYCGLGRCTDHVSVLLPDSDLGEWKVALDQLPGELQKYVNEDNAKFEREMFDWDEEVQRRKDAQAAKLHESTPEQPLSTTDLRQGQCALMLLYSIHKFKYSDFLFSKDCYCNFFNVVRATVIATSGLCSL